MASHALSQTLEPSSPKDAAQNERMKLDSMEPILVLNTHMTSDELHTIEDTLIEYDAPLTFDTSEAVIFIGKIQQKRRAAMELRTRNVFTEEKCLESSNEPENEQAQKGYERSMHKGEKRPLNSPASEHAQATTVNLTGDSAIESESESVQSHEKSLRASHGDQKLRVRTNRASEESDREARLVRVIRSEWLFDSVRAERVLPFDDYSIYIGQRTERPTFHSNIRVGPRATLSRSTSNAAEYFSSHQRAVEPTEILERARAEYKPPSPKQIPRKRFHGAVDSIDQGKAYSSSTQKIRLTGHSVSDGVAPLLRQSTSEHDLDLVHDIPEPPEWVKKGYRYSCQRSTPVNNPNTKFISMLKAIRQARDLTADEIGVRAYSTAIAALGAYPYTLTSPREILALPGCSAKIAALFAEWKNNGGQDVAAVKEINEDERLQVLRLFFDIWGVGSKTAREFYDRGWRDLDDIVEFGWNDLSRIQQIGVKFYDEFKEKIPRAEVETIRDVVHEHVQRVCGRPYDVRTCIVGGYRRGKAESGDADIMVSHLDEARLIEVVDDIVASLHEEKWITHSLKTTRSGSRRGQNIIPLKGPGAGSGFDKLDKAMVVWQDPKYNPANAIDGKNPNIHRRVDIIVSPWRTVGCAVLGWSAGTTFERDLRRYSKHVKKWKFDSSGIRDQVTGDIVDVEARGGRPEDMEQAERKVFEGLGLEYKEPWERCTG